MGKVAEVYRVASGNFKKNPGAFAVFSAASWLCRHLGRQRIRCTRAAGVQAFGGWIERR
jgi:hypothetical protein